MARKPRHMNPEEEALWRKVTEGTDPLHPGKPKPRGKAPKTPDPDPARRADPVPDAPAPLPAFRVGERGGGKRPDHDLAPTLRDHMAQSPIEMDRKRYQKMKRGRLAPEARIDLHGMTLAEAYPALVGFILGSASEGCRLVLVITGKGRVKDDHGPIPQRHGVLRHQVPHWLKTGVLKPYVLQITEAHLKHGGHGAYYVYLRRPR